MIVVVYIIIIIIKDTKSLWDNCFLLRNRVVVVVNLSILLPKSEPRFRIYYMFGYMNICASGWF